MVWVHVTDGRVVRVSERCFGVQEAVDDASHLVILHVLGAEAGPARMDYYFLYFDGEAKQRHFAATVRGALDAVQKPRRFLVVLNAESGQGRARAVLADVVQPMLAAAGCALVLRESEYNRHVPLFASQLRAGDVDGVLLVGGDGTVNEFVNGLLGRRDWPELCARLPISLVPCGSRMQLATRFGAADPVLCVFAALRARTVALHPLAFVQAHRRFYGHSYLQVRPKKRLFLKFYYLNGSGGVGGVGGAGGAGSGADASTGVATASSASTSDVGLQRGPPLRFYEAFRALLEAQSTSEPTSTATATSIPPEVSCMTIAIDGATELQLVNTFDPTAQHPLALMSASCQPRLLQRLWRRISCQVADTDTDTGSLAPGHAMTQPALLAMTRAGLLLVSDDARFPPSLNHDRWFVDGEIVGTESIYFESLDAPLHLTIPPPLLQDPQ